VRLFVTDTPIRNAVATGMNVGRGRITLTSSVLKMPPESVESIIAHEAVHVKKRDAFWSQIIIGVPYMTLMLYFLQNTGNPYATSSGSSGGASWGAAIFGTPVLLLMIQLFYSFPSIVGQFMETRADHLGASFLDGKYKQMSDGLKRLAKDTTKDLKYLMSYDADKSIKAEIDFAKRHKDWAQRFIQFQYFSHPPMYWRIKSLLIENPEWGKGMAWRWFVDRNKESLPGLFKNKRNNK